MQSAGRMSLAIVYCLIQLMLLLAVAVRTDAEGSRLEVDTPRTASSVDSPPAAEAATAADLGKQSEFVSRRRWYGAAVMPWNNEVMAWLKRSAQHNAKRGWGNGIPPWMRRRVVVLPVDVSDW